MGLLDSFINKAVRTATNTITDTIIDNTVKPTVEKTLKDTLGIGDIKYDIPNEYNSFPKYPGSMINKPYEIRTNKYNRLTINYSGSIKREFENDLLASGYIKASNVRFDKDNTYVIVESLGSNTKIAYHIKR